MKRKLLLVIFWLWRGSPQGSHWIWWLMLWLGCEQGEWQWCLWKHGVTAEPSYQYPAVIRSKQDCSRTSQYSVLCYNTDFSSALKNQWPHPCSQLWETPTGSILVRSTASQWAGYNLVQMWTAFWASLTCCGWTNNLIFCNNWGGFYFASVYLNHAHAYSKQKHWRDGSCSLYSGKLSGLSLGFCPNWVLGGLLCAFMLWHGSH